MGSKRLEQASKNDAKRKSCTAGAVATPHRRVCFTEKTGARGFACQEFDLPGQHHFDAAQQFDNPDTPILKAKFAMIR